jgi:starch phosphorylase
MLLTQELVHGVDVWINTPRRPWEACGTSGMKVLVNGGLNLSELDGWWAEAYSPEVGWAIGDGKEHGEDQAWDATEADELYSVLEREVIPQFYERNESGMPAKWLGRIRAWRSLLRHFPPPVLSANTRKVTICLPLPVTAIAQPVRERKATASSSGRRFARGVASSRAKRQGYLDVRGLFVATTI